MPRIKIAAKASKRVAAVSGVAAAHVSVLHYFLHFLDFVATWRVVSEVLRGLPEYLNGFGYVAILILPIAGGSVLVYRFCESHDRKPSEAAE